MNQTPPLALIYLMKSSTPYWIGLGSSEQDEVELPERTVIMALAFYTIMAMAVYILILFLFYLFFCQPAWILGNASASSSSDDVQTPMTKKRKAAKKNKKKKAAKKNKKKKSAKRKQLLAKTKKPGPPGEGLDLDVTLDKTGKKAVSTNEVHSFASIYGCTIL